MSFFTRPILLFFAVFMIPIIAESLLKNENPIDKPLGAVEPDVNPTVLGSNKSYRNESHEPLHARDEDYVDEMENLIDHIAEKLFAYQNGVTNPPESKREPSINLNVVVTTESPLEVNEYDYVPQFENLEFINSKVTSAVNSIFEDHESFNFFPLNYLQRLIFSIFEGIKNSIFWGSSANLKIEGNVNNLINNFMTLIRRDVNINYFPKVLLHTLYPIVSDYVVPELSGGILERILKIVDQSIIIRFPSSIVSLIFPNNIPEDLSRKEGLTVSELVKRLFSNLKQVNVKNKENKELEIEYKASMRDFISILTKDIELNGAPWTSLTTCAGRLFKEMATFSIDSINRKRRRANSLIFPGSLDADLALDKKSVKTRKMSGSRKLVKQNIGCESTFLQEFMKGLDEYLKEDDDDDDLEVPTKENYKNVILKILMDYLLSRF